MDLGSSKLLEHSDAKGCLGGLVARDIKIQGLRSVRRECGG
jgi:hypothetical protein